MRDLAEMWKHTRMVVLVAVIAAVYAAILLPFKLFPIIPGLTEARPANAIPPLASFLFGPAAAWGIAFGNLIADFFGTFGPVTLWGCTGNLLLGWIPYRMWRASSADLLPLGLAERPSSGRAFASFLPYVWILLVSNAACVVWILWGLVTFKAAPLAATPHIAGIILANNMAMGLVLTPLLSWAVARRVVRWGLTDREIMDDAAPPRRGIGVGAVLLPVAAFGGLALAYVLAQGDGTLAGLGGTYLLGVPAVAILIGTMLL